LRLVSSFCDRVLVMYAGRIVEEIAATDLANAKHPYTRGLLGCLPQLGSEQPPTARARPADGVVAVSTPAPRRVGGRALCAG
jgi:ABC-type dipeptide/oligopeptide/nickel transport system ATPase component